jgi:hypothetical protein
MGKSKLIKIYKQDAKYLDAARLTKLGRVSFADIIMHLCEVHRLAIRKGLIKSDIEEW